MTKQIKEKKQIANNKSEMTFVDIGKLMTSVERIHKTTKKTSMSITFFCDLICISYISKTIYLKMNNEKQSLTAIYGLYHQSIATQ